MISRLLYLVLFMVSCVGYGMYSDTKGQSNCILVKKHAKIMQELLHNNRSVYQNLMNATYPLHYACRLNLYEVVLFLLKQGAFCNEEGINKITPLHEASLAGHHNIVRLLLTYGALDSADDKNKEYCLHKAVQSKNEESIQLLLDAGCFVNNCDIALYTCFDKACFLFRAYKEDFFLFVMYMFVEYGVRCPHDKAELCYPIIDTIPNDFFQYPDKISIIKRCLAFKKDDLLLVQIRKRFPCLFNKNRIVDLITAAHCGEQDLYEICVHAFFVNSFLCMHDFLHRYSCCTASQIGKSMILKRCVKQTQCDVVYKMYATVFMQKQLHKTTAYRDCSLFTYH